MSEDLIEQQIQILERNRTAWNGIVRTSSIPEDIAPGVTKKAIAKAFDMVISRLKESEVKGNPFLMQALTANLSSWTTTLESWIASTPSSPTMAANIFSHLNAIWSQFGAYAETSAKELSPRQLSKLAVEHQELSKKIKILLAELPDLIKGKSQLSAALSTAKEFEKTSTKILENIKEAKALAEADAAVSSAHRESIEHSKIEVEEHLNALNKIVQSIPEFELQRKEMLEKCSAILEEAESRLDAASRAGMAASFSDRSKEYVLPRVLWLSTFVLSLGLVSGLAYCYILPTLQDHTGVDRLILFATDLPLTVPLIWLAWFSALRFSQLGRFKEDYAFKVATALSLDGYRKEAAGISPDLEKQLLDLAIRNFGDNPLRLMTKESAKDAHPLAGALDVKTLTEIIQNAFKNPVDKK